MVGSLVENEDAMMLNGRMEISDLLKRLKGHD